MSAPAHRVTTRLVVTSVVAVLAGCGSSAPDTAPGTAPRTAPASTPAVLPDTVALPLSTSPDPLDGVTGELILTRQRDLIDRGLINVLVRNESDTPMLLSDIELVADFFDAPPASSRSISVRSGRQVAIQVPYGETDDCRTERPVTARLAFTSTGDDGSVPHATGVELDGTDLLDTIRAEQCAARRFDAAVRTRFDGTAIVDGTVVTGLVIEPTDPATGMMIDAVSGTVLVGVRPGDAWTSTRLGADPVTIPLMFVVNRCDPHALAEVTKRYGLELAVSVDGAEPVDVAVDIDDLVDDLDTIVEQCTAETGAA